MQSMRQDLTLKAVSPDDVPTILPIANHVFLSDHYCHTPEDQYISLQVAKFSQPVMYPVLFEPGIPKDKMLLPDDLRDCYAFDGKNKLKCSVRAIQEERWINASQLTLAIQKIHGPQSDLLKIDANKLSEAVRDAIFLFNQNFPLVAGQVIVVPFYKNRLDLRVGNIVTEMTLVKSKQKMTVRLAEFTNINFDNELPKQIFLSDSHTSGLTSVMSDIPVSFFDKGVGGNGAVISRLIRTVFLTRSMTPAMLKAYGITKHAKGAILYGPPGTGKTLIAKRIGELFTKEAVKLIEGPALKNRFYGQTQQNLADLFSDARYNPERLFVYLFDEIDALFPVRGSDSSVTTSTNNDLVSRMLSIIDGLLEMNNVVIIGTSNRLELIDPAILRAGRLAEHIYVGLPNESDRLDILRVHTNDMQDTLAPDVNLVEIAHLTKNYTGADLANLISEARTYAVAKNYAECDGSLSLRKEVTSIDQVEKVSQQYLLRAVNAFKSHFSTDDECLASDAGSFVMYDTSIKSTLLGLSQPLSCLKSGDGLRQLNVLIHGASGTGKSSLAIELARSTGFPYLQLVNAEKMQKIPVNKRSDYLADFFARAYQSVEPSVIILDDLEDIIESSADGSTYNNQLRLMLSQCLRKSATQHHKLLVIATALDIGFIECLRLDSYFDERASLLPLRLDLRDPRQCGETIRLLAESVGLKSIKPLRGPNLSAVIEITIKALLYQLQKYQARMSMTPILDMSDFIKSLPQLTVATQVKEVFAVSHESKAVKPSLFAP